MTNRELDKWIQEYIIGYGGLKIVYTWHDRKKRENPIEVFSSSPPDSHELGDYTAFVDEEGTKIYCGKPYSIFHIQRYTTDISNTFQVVEKMREKGFSFKLGDNHSAGPWYCCFTILKNREFWAYSKVSLALAICSAAEVAIEATE